MKEFEEKEFDLYRNERVLLKLNIKMFEEYNHMLPSHYPDPRNNGKSL